MTEEKKEKFDVREFFNIFMIIIVCLFWIFLGFNLKSKKEQIQINNNPLIVSSAKSVNEISNYDNVSDLTGTTWILKDTLTYIGDYNFDNVLYICNGYNFNKLNIYLEGLYYNYTIISMTAVYPINDKYIHYVTSMFEPIPEPRPEPSPSPFPQMPYWSWCDFYGNSVNYSECPWLEFTFTGGTDVTNTTLINWLYANATLQQSQPTQLITPIITKSAYNQLSWSSVQNATGYAIYKDNQLYDTIINTLYNVTALGSYQVVALGDNESYLDSDLSNTIIFSAIQLSAPVLSLNNNQIVWSNVQNASAYEIYKDNILIDTINNNSYLVEYNGTYQVKAISNSVFFTDSNLSSILNVNFNFAEVVFYAKDNITELLHIENWLVGQSLYNFSNTNYSYNDLLDLIYSDFGSVGRVIFNDNQLFSGVYFDKYYIVSGDVSIYYKIDTSFGNNYNLSDYTVTSSNSDTLFSNLGNNLISDISLSFIDTTFNWVFIGSSYAQTSSIITMNMTLYDGFVLGDNFSIYTDSFGNKFYFDCIVTQSSSETIYINYLYKCDIISDSFVIPSMDYNKFVFYDENTQKYQFIQSSGNTIVSIVNTLFETSYKINQYNNYYYCNYIGFSFNIQNYSGSNNKLFSFVQDTNGKYYEYYYNYSGFNNNQNNFEYILINSDNFNSYIYDKTYLYFNFSSLLQSQGLSTLYDNKNDCVTALENLSIKFTFGNPIIYYYDATDKTNNSTGVGIIPTSSNGLYKTDFAWYDVTAYIYNFFIYLIFDMPIVSNIVKLVYQIIQLILFIINQIILLFSGVKNNIFIVAILGFLLLKFAIDLLVKH